MPIGWLYTRWWFQPIWKICSSNWIISPIFGVKTKNIWVATTQDYKLPTYPLRWNHVESTDLDTIQPRNNQRNLLVHLKVEPMSSPKPVQEVRPHTDDPSAKTTMHIPTKPITRTLTAGTRKYPLGKGETSTQTTSFWVPAFSFRRCINWCRTFVVIFLMNRMGVWKGVHEFPEMGKKHHFKGDMFLEAASFEGLKFDFPLEEIEALTKYLHQVVLIRFLNVKCRARHLAGCRRIWLQLHYLGICLNLRCKCFRAKNYLFTGFCISSINRLDSPYVGYLDNGSHDGRNAEHPVRVYSITPGEPKRDLSI